MGQEGGRVQEGGMGQWEVWSRGTEEGGIGMPQTITSHPNVQCRHTCTNCTLFAHAFLGIPR